MPPVVRAASRGPKDRSRLFRARAYPGKEAALAEKLRSTSGRLVREQAAFLGLVAAGPLEPGARDFVFATLWRDFAGLEAMFGAHWREPLLPAGYAELIEWCSVEHFALTGEFRNASNDVGPAA